jgi:hypothetical protein
MKMSHTIWSIIRRNKWAGKKLCRTIRLGLTSLCLTSGLLLTGGRLLGQSAIQINGEDVTAGAEDESADSAAPYVVFTNLLNSAGARYNNSIFNLFPVAGREAHGVTETLHAVRFVPKDDVQVTVLSAAVQWISGTRLVELEIYDSNGEFGEPGTPIPGSLGSTTNIPDLGTCCQLTTVTLPGSGVFLSKGVSYYLVAHSDETQGPTFSGAWCRSFLGISANLVPPNPWSTLIGGWLAAEIRGTRVGGSAPPRPEIVASSESSAADGKVVIFSNLDRVTGKFYIPGFGLLLAGSDVALYPEAWEALPFTPKTDVHAQSLSAAIGYLSGTKKINLSLWSDSGGVPGAPLPGGRGSTTDVPDSGNCCALAKVRLPGEGVALAANVQVWLVASPNDKTAADFHGIWQFSNLALIAFIEPQESNNWIAEPSEWLAAEIRGTSP